MGTEPTQMNDQLKLAQDFVNKMASVHEEAWLVLEKVVAEMKKYYNRRQWPDTLQVGDLVYLSTKDLSMDWPSKKLDYKQVGPFPILKKHGHSYELKLPASYKVHLVFLVVKLSLVQPDEWECPHPCVILKVWDPVTGELIN